MLAIGVLLGGCDGKTGSTGTFTQDPSAPCVSTREVCNGVDDDCDGGTDEDVIDAPVWFLDRDGDGHGDGAAPFAQCEVPDGYTTTSDDCDDGLPTIHPGADELCNGLDDDCDLQADEDFDGDGDGSADPARCALGADCDDADPAIHPGQPEVCGNGIDEDCDPATGCGFVGTRSAGDADATFTGEVTGDGLGYRLDVGDLDADGALDLVVAAIHADGDQGAVYLVDPLAGGSVAGARVRWAGATGSTGSGSQLAIGDLDGDGTEDLLAGLGALGRVVRLDDVATPVQTLDDAPQVGASGLDDAYGAALALGDVDGDGLLDLAVGATLADLGAADAGAVSVYRGPVADEVGAAAWEIAGETASAHAGTTILAADVDGSGVDDLVIGADTAPGGPADGGAYYVLLDPPTGALSVADADAVLVGEGAGDQAAAEAPVAGDLDGDGRVDLVVSAPTRGTIYAFTAAPAGTVSLATAAIRVDALGLGTGVSLADFEGDGVLDLAAGGSGEVLVFAGPLAGTLDPTHAMCTIAPTVPSAAFGVDAAAADVDADGWPDLVVGDAALETAGVVYVLLAEGP